jgi:hypothetical protein
MGSRVRVPPGSPKILRQTMDLRGGASAEKQGGRFCARPIPARRPLARSAAGGGRMWLPARASAWGRRFCGGAAGPAGSARVGWGRSGAKHKSRRLQNRGKLFESYSAGDVLVALAALDRVSYRLLPGSGFF